MSDYYGKMGYGLFKQDFPEPNLGMIEPPRADLSKWRGRQNPDGTRSSIVTISVGFDDGEVLIPTLTPEGKQMSPDEAIRRFRETGEHFGVFKDPGSASRYAEQLSNRGGSFHDQR